MKCLTICQPYAHLIVTPHVELPPGHLQKRCENRTWGTAYRGPLLIHAGKSVTWLETYRDVEALGPMVLGQIVGITNLVDCVPINWGHDPATGRRARQIPRFVQSLHPWLITHEHAEGPQGLILLGAKKFASPIPLRGEQGLFDVPEQGEIWESVLAQIQKSGFNLPAPHSDRKAAKGHRSRC